MEHLCSPRNNNTNTSSPDVEAANPQPSPLRKMIMVASMAVGIQFGWALQLSLLTPYVQLLGIPHKWAPYIWLCGPISGLVVQPVVGYYSDQCTSRFGRRRPFIFSGSIVVSVAVFLIGYAADIGHLFGDDLTKETRPRAIGFFVAGFWILDVANNMLQGPCRAFLGDLAAGDHRKTRTANSFYSFFMAIGNVLGYAAGSYGGLHRIFPFTTTKACDVFCANLKSCFFLSIFLLLSLTCIVLFCVNDRPITAKENEEESRISGFGQLEGALKELKRPMWMLMLVTALNWIAWFPFFLFDTDWMGRDVYGGYNVREKAYNAGVREGALGLMLNSVVLGLISLAIEPLGRLVGSVKWLWGIVNLILAFCLAMTILITKVAKQEHHASAAVKVATLIFFSILGIPLAITYSVPFALASIYSTTTGAGQGLSVGILNIAIVGAQILVSAISGPWDALFGRGNTPMFLVGAVAAAVSAVLVIVLLPNPKPVDLEEASATTQGGFH